MTPATFGIDLGGTNLRSGVVDGAGTLVADQRVPTPPTLDGIIDTIAGSQRWGIGTTSRHVSVSARQG